jgi:hypothetical protein
LVNKRKNVHQCLRNLFTFVLHEAESRIILSPPGLMACPIYFLLQDRPWR